MKKYIGVIAPYKRDYKIWIEDNKKEGENYAWIHTVDDVRGREFIRIEKTDRAYLVDSKVHEVAELRIRL